MHVWLVSLGGMPFSEGKQRRVDLGERKDRGEAGRGEGKVHCGGDIIYERGKNK